MTRTVKAGLSRLKPDSYDTFLSTLGFHSVAYLLFLVVFAEVGFLLGYSLSQFTLPLSFALYVLGGVAMLMTKKAKMFTAKGLAAFILVAFALFVVGGWLFAKTYDTSYDGQSYHQSGMLSLAAGWNPARTDKMPLPIREGQVYVIGYPKALWTIEASIYKTIGKVNSATVVNLAFAVIAGIYVLLLCRQLDLGRFLTPFITVAAVLHPIFLQQIFTFMADGASYEMGLAAIALFGLILLQKRLQLQYVVPFFAVLVLLVGTKYNNAFLVIMLAILYVFIMVRRKQLWQKPHLVTMGAFVILTLAALWVPFATNAHNHHALLYPMNQSAQKNSLRYDNIPQNLKHESSVSLLFYGIFSEGQPTWAGDPKSDANVANLKIPFTVSSQEWGSIANFQGRVGAGGPLFGGLIILSVLLLIGCFAVSAATESKQDEKKIQLALILTALLLVLALVNPIPNKLRYAPFITLIPLIMLGISQVLSRRPRYLRALQGLVIVGLIANITCTLGPLIGIRAQEFSTKRQELTTMAQNGPYKVVSNKFYSIYNQLEENHVAVEPAMGCGKNVRATYLAYSFKTAKYCLTQAQAK